MRACAIAALILGASSLRAEAPPTRAEQESFLAAAQQTAMAYSASLPDFSCIQTIRRYDVRPGKGVTPLDTVTVSVGYAGQAEQYTIVSVVPPQAYGNLNNLEGVMSRGDFGINQRSVFDPLRKAEFQFARWREFNGRKSAVYSYLVDWTNSLYVIGLGPQVRAVVGLRGEMIIDLATHAVLWISYIAKDIPEKFPISASEVTVEYGIAEIDGKRYLVPFKAIADVRQAQRMRRNTIEFHTYRKFNADSNVQYEGVDSTIKYDGPKP